MKGRGGLLNNRIHGVHLLEYITVSLNEKFLSASKQALVSLVVSLYVLRVCVVIRVFAHVYVNVLQVHLLLYHLLF